MPACPIAPILASHSVTGPTSMSDDASPRLGLPYVAAGQLSKHVTVNEAMARLDGLVQMCIESRSLSAQPPDPADGSLYLLPNNASGAAWTGRPAGVLMRFEAGGWSPFLIARGQVAWLRDEALLILYTGSGWIAAASGGSSDSLPMLGIGTPSSATNPLSVRANSVLLTARPESESGTGDMRLTLNRDTISDTGSLLFQTGYSGRAEIGLTGSTGLDIKTSPDGLTWTQALRIDTATGLASAAGPPTQASGLATKGYVDTQTLAHAAELTMLCHPGPAV